MHIFNRVVYFPVKRSSLYNNTSCATLSSGIPQNISRVTCIFLVYLYTRAFRLVCIPRKYKRLVGDSRNFETGANADYRIM